MHPAIPMIKRLKAESSIFRLEEKYLPLFMNSQKTALIPSAPVSAGRAIKRTWGLHTSRPTGEKRSLERLSVWTRMIRKYSRHTTKLRRLLKTGMASAMIHARIHSTRTMPVHIPIAFQSRRCMRSLFRNKRTNTYFAATWPLTTPPKMIWLVGQRPAHEILRGGKTYCGQSNPIGHFRYYVAGGS